MRVQKYIAMCGACSRRTAEDRMRDGRVTVNGTVVSPGAQIAPGRDVVRLDGRIVSPTEERIYIMLHKPAGYITSMKDEKGRKTVSDLVGDVGQRVYPVGRLDYLSEGLLLMTNDGSAAQKLTHPSYRIRKTYKVWVKGEDPRGAAESIRGRTVYQGETYCADGVRVLDDAGGNAVLEITVSEGKNHEVRNLCAAAGLTVKRLLRVSLGDLRLGDLQPGEWRYLTRKEIDWISGISRQA